MPGKNKLLDWAKTAKRNTGGVPCGTCDWLKRRRIAKDPVVGQLEDLLQQIRTGQIRVSMTEVAKRLAAEHGYPLVPCAFAKHLRRCRPDLLQSNGA